jgi:hypothetical protein
VPSNLFARDGSTVTNTIIEGGLPGTHQIGLLVDATSTAVGVTFVHHGDKFDHGAELGLDNPLSFKGTIKGLGVGDFIQFGGLG